MAQLNSQSCVDARLKRELAVGKKTGRGKSKVARLAQELLRTHGINVVIDGNLGPATEAGLAKFCSDSGKVFTGQVDQQLIDALAEPLLQAAAQPSAKLGDSLGQTVAATARRHLDLHPLEIGGPNRGPWVRLYMSGSEGAEYPWCAGFVTYVVRQAAMAHGTSSPITRTFSCDNIGIQAKQKAGKFVTRTSPAQAPVGSLFLVPHGTNKNDWVHTGIIVESEFEGPGQVFCTIEGNTNDEGSREGFEVCQRYRLCSKVDIVML
jgi:hypothetical protein